MKEFMVSTSGHALKSHKTYNVFLLTYLFNNSELDNQKITGIIKCEKLYWSRN